MCTFFSSRCEIRFEDVGDKGRSEIQRGREEKNEKEGIHFTKKLIVWLSFQYHGFIVEESLMGKVSTYLLVLFSLIIKNSFKLVKKIIPCVYT